ncbi:unnamed protein product [Ilex paraguariensis]|uniref:Uncharacterized protein n=1 Tax=Ilex paraguariensis TaxID=185542 RepID=A0ABC8R6M7_9AQUA
MLVQKVGGCSTTTKLDWWVEIGTAACSQDFWRLNKRKFKFFELMVAWYRVLSCCSVLCVIQSFVITFPCTLKVGIPNFF